MKLNFKKFIPHTLIFMLIASSPVNVLSTTAFAEQAPLNVIDTELNMPTVNDPDDSSSGKDNSNDSGELTSFEERYEKAKETMESKRTYLQKRELVLNAIEDFKKEPTVENLQLVMDYVVLLPKSPTDRNKGDKVEVSSLISDELVAMLKDSEEKKLLLFHYADKAIERTWETLTHLDLDIAIKAVHLLPDGEEKEQYQKEAEELYRAVYKKHSNPDTGYIDWNDPNIEYGEPPKKEGGRDNWRPGVDGDKYLKEYEKNKPNLNDWNFSEGFSNFRYSYENGACYKTTMEYDSKGNLVKRVKNKASESEKAFCNVEIPRKGIADYYESSSWTRNYVSQLDGSAERQDTLANYNKQKEADLSHLSTDTIQYTFEKDSDSPYYYDTGIYVSKDGTISYQQARDALFQISVQAQGKFVEDVDKALALLDGLIILVEDNNKPIPVEEFIALFDETSIGVKAQGTRSGDKYELPDLIEVKEVSSVIVNGKKVDLEATPIIDNSYVLFPIDSIAKSLGAKVLNTDNSTTVEYKGDRITFTDSESTVKVNETVKPLNVPTRQNKDGIRMVDVDALLNFFGLTLEVESESDQIIIKNKQ